QAAAMPEVVILEIVILEIKSSTAGGNMRTASYAPWSVLRHRIHRFAFGFRIMFPTRLPHARKRMAIHMTARIHFRGTLSYRLRSASELSRCILEASARRALKGPRLPGWSWFLELATDVLKQHTLTAFQMGDVNDSRRYLDSIVIGSPALSEVSITPVVQEKFSGSWFAGKNTKPSVSVLYFHGGGYSYYPRAYANFIALITLAANSKTLALDYRLSPEHRFPTQLEDALNAYRWLLATGVDPDHLIFAGDSAGANLTLALLLAARESKLPHPALAIALSPPTDFEMDLKAPDLTDKGAFDWIDTQMLEQWADWFCDSAERN